MIYILFIDTQRHKEWAKRFETLSQANLYIETLTPVSGRQAIQMSWEDIIQFIPDLDSDPVLYRLQEIDRYMKGKEIDRHMQEEIEQHAEMLGGVEKVYNIALKLLMKKALENQKESVKQ